MGEIADAMLEGVLCQECGVFIDDSKHPGYVGASGYPRYCYGCGGDPTRNGAVKRNTGTGRNTEDHG
jgi:hypothetical protein